MKRLQFIVMIIIGKTEKEITDKSRKLRGKQLTQLVVILKVMEIEEMN